VFYLLCQHVELALQCNYMVSSYMALWLMLSCKLIKTHKFHLWGFRHYIKLTRFLKPPRCVQYCTHEMHAQFLPFAPSCAWRICAVQRASPCNTT